MTNKSHLKYLFEAELKDGTTFKQNPDDTSVKFPPTKDSNGNIVGKSSFSDIQEDVDKFNIKRFTLVEQVVFGRRFTVDLTDGHFEINGINIEVEGDIPLPGITDFKLVFFRVRRQHFNFSTQDRKFSFLDESPIKYMIGWQTKIKGKIYTQKILIQ